MNEKKQNNDLIKEIIEKHLTSLRVPLETFSLSHAIFLNVLLARSYLLIFLFVPRNSAIIKLDLSCHYSDIVLLSFPYPLSNMV